MIKVISFSLWGNNPKYTIGAVKNAELAKTVYPGWIPRFYVGSCVEEKIKNQLVELGSQIVDKNVIGDWTGMFWRFEAASDPTVDIMISRDCDSRLSEREKLAVDDWLNSDKKFHIMRDHPAHATEILGGMWGTKAPVLREMSDLISGYLKGNFWQVDQNFLREVVYPRVKHLSKVHDPFFQKIPFPSERKNAEFVGDVFDQNDVRHPEYWKSLV